MQCRPKYLVEEHFREYETLDEVLSTEQEYPLQQFYLVPWRWSFIAQHRRESEVGSSKALWLYHWYRFLVLDIAMHLLILLVVRLLRFQVAVKSRVSLDCARLCYPKLASHWSFQFTDGHGARIVSTRRNRTLCPAPSLAKRTFVSQECAHGISKLAR